ncbi:acetyl-CoA carboxylase biotin carboxyl carrier protein [Deinococcus metallilatus]|uniref:Biotin carboxyl carrier protein of acetyl-CoA carboxylase n=1 Tax=Deinococcus metallilatus TaxID=1211322 RepID=A0AAJ5F2Z2_9DEIO|nr:acetyl-CoA carboxylase biotin carboxyl carrier protein [Deinococcus metallilatus]MBB5295394.1 acetyl-CoA carboxylase biotin carboxyl carrier protein [Deinococcus metallilatus]QBY08076.1 acetyl-CoA carboxylase biotin carboxyl carrier protein [Deinococcus metallilatus]RXJ12969.1 acetyl-CoA carboxylase biotin carboxyl carrier protein [Deinococcus metallilatus]TLK27109.1 acetyl-CoA carboxylase biotin carboxyl carrier protein [Deinococcus metallilatus]GMA16071.1 acetyl-CoA carboxylase biotin car
MNPDDLKKILDALSTADVREFSLTTGSFALDLKRGPVAVSGPAPAASPPAAPLPVAAPSFQAPAASTPAPTAPATPAAETPAAPAAEAAPAAPARSASTGTPVKAPIVGTFYAAASPDAPPYVKVGDTVSAGQVLCIIEAMKLMNEIEAEVSGTVREILVKNAEPVEYGQTLFMIE